MSVKDPYYVVVPFLGAIDIYVHHEIVGPAFVTEIRSIHGSIDKLERLQGVYFKWKKNLDAGDDIGFIAEEVGKVLPEIVVYEENGVDAVDG